MVISLIFVPVENFDDCLIQFQFRYGTGKIFFFSKPSVHFNKNVDFFMFLYFFVLILRSMTESESE